MGCRGARRSGASSEIRRLTETPLQELRFARQRLADEVPDEATNDDVLAQFGNLGIQQVANCHIGIFDEALLDQANGAIEFLEFALDNFVRERAPACLVPVPCKFRVPLRSGCPEHRRG